MNARNRYEPRSRYGWPEWTVTVIALVIVAYDVGLATGWLA